MELLISNYNGTLSQALQLGISLGVMVGIIIFTLVVADGGQFRVAFGLLIGGLLMGLLQSVQVGQLIASAANQNTLVIGSVQMDMVAQAAISGFFRTIEAAILGGLIMIIVFSPGEAIRGAAIGFVVGVVSALAGWALLGLFNVQPPNYLFALAMLVMSFLIYNTFSLRVAG